MTDLFVATSGLDPADVRAAVPPACWRPLDGIRIETNGDEAVVEFAESTPRRPATHLLPSLSALTTEALAFRFELSVRAGAGWTPWAATATIGEPMFPESADATNGGLVIAIDEATASPPADAVKLRLRVRSPDIAAVLRAPWCVTLSASDGGVTSGDLAAAVPAALSVPPISQMAEGGDIAAHVCSPTSVAMVLGYWGESVDCRSMAQAVFHRALNRYGIWPAAVQAAARRGIAGYLLRFPSWDAAAWCLARGLPIVASVRWTPGELEGAPIHETTGHLLVVTGWEDGWVLVNDPAAPDRASVPRRYRLEQLRRTWLERSGVGYVFFRPTTSPSARSPRR